MQFDFTIRTQNVWDAVRGKPSPQNLVKLYDGPNLGLDKSGHPTQGQTLRTPDDAGNEIHLLRNNLKQAPQDTAHEVGGHALGLIPSGQATEPNHHDDRIAGGGCQLPGTMGSVMAPDAHSGSPDALQMEPRHVAMIVGDSVRQHDELMANMGSGTAAAREVEQHDEYDVRGVGGGVGGSLEGPPSHESTQTGADDICGTMAPFPPVTERGSP